MTKNGGIIIMSEQEEKIKRHAKVVSFINMKGGVGKTTLTKEIGYHLVKNGKRVLLIDIDPQINLTQSLFKKYNYAQSEEIAKKERLRQDNKKLNLKIAKHSVKEVIIGTVADESGLTYKDIALELEKNFYIIPGELGVNFITRATDNSSIENSIYNFIEDSTLREDFDYIFIDCPPTYSSYTIAAFKASDFYLIPIKADAYSLLGIDMLFKVVNEIKKVNKLYFRDKPLKLLGIILSDVESSPGIGKMNLMEDIRSSKKLKDKYIFENTFLHNVNLQQDLGYFIDDSNSVKKSKPNLKKICNEFERRIKENE